MKQGGGGNQEEKGLLNGLFNTFRGGDSKGGAGPQGVVSKETYMKYSKDDEKKIRALLGKIDNIFKSECVFCGTVW